MARQCKLILCLAADLIILSTNLRVATHGETSARFRVFRGKRRKISEPDLKKLFQAIACGLGPVSSEKYLTELFAKHQRHLTGSVHAARDTALDLAERYFIGYVYCCFHACIAGLLQVTCRCTRVEGSTEH